MPTPLTQARNHYLSALYRSVFADRRADTRIICWSKMVIDDELGVADYEAQILVRHRMALIRVGSDGIAYLSPTTTGARKASKHRLLKNDKGEVLSRVAPVAGPIPIDLKAVSDACSQVSMKFTVNGLY